MVDEDLGLSGSGIDKRSGFARLIAAIAMRLVGIVLGLEVSRLARNNADWLPAARQNLCFSLKVMRKVEVVPGFQHWINRTVRTCAAMWRGDFPDEAVIHQSLKRAEETSFVDCALFCQLAKRRFTIDHSKHAVLIVRQLLRPVFHLENSSACFAHNRIWLHFCSSSTKSISARQLCRKTSAFFSKERSTVVPYLLLGQMQEREVYSSLHWPETGTSMSGKEYINAELRRHDCQYNAIDDMRGRMVSSHSLLITWTNTADPRHVCVVRRHHAYRA